MKKILYFIACLIIALGVTSLWLLRFDVPQVTLGVTFTPSYARYLQLPAHETFTRMLADLHPAVVRLPVEWDETELQQNNFSFTDLDWYVAEAAQHNAKIILAVGRRTPRWPECHIPTWAAGMDTPTQDTAVLQYLQAAVTHFKNDAALTTWQVENEPLLDQFGNCPPSDPAFFKKEIALVKSLDSAKPILTTDTGELTWWNEARAGDVFGSTLYRTVFSTRLQKPFYYWYLPPVYYAAKALVSGVPLKNFIISELQAEPWTDKQTNTVVPVSAADVTQNILFARKTGAHEILLWGVEYWYAAAARGDSSYIDTLKPFFAAP